MPCVDACFPWTADAALTYRVLTRPSQMLDELILAGEMQESSKKSVLRAISQSDAIEEQESSEDSLARLGSRT